jgi:hypothetical protein
MKTIAYRLTPIQETPPGGIATAAVMTCMATGEMLSGMGGGGTYLSPRIVEALRAPGAKAIVDQGDLDALLSLARDVASGDVGGDDSGRAVQILDAMGETA